MDKFTGWQGMTQTHGFSVDVFHDSAAGMFIAQLNIYSPPLMQRIVPGVPTEVIQFDEPETLKHGSLDELRERTKQRIAARCGEILQFSEAKRHAE